MIRGVISDHVRSVTFHYDDGSQHLLASDDARLTDATEVSFPLHRGEHITLVRCRHHGPRHRPLQCGVEFETSLGRSLVLCRRPDSWREPAVMREWRAGPGRCIVELCHARDWIVDPDGGPGLVQVRPPARETVGDLYGSAVGAATLRCRVPWFLVYLECQYLGRECLRGLLAVEHTLPGPRSMSIIAIALRGGRALD
jgi:hypothetical protein